MEQGDKPEFKSLIYCLQKCGLGFVIVEGETRQVYRLLSDDELRMAIEKVEVLFTVGSQWVAVYRVLVDFYGFPNEISAFCNRMKGIMGQVKLTYPCKYQSIQKALTSSTILSKHYNHWKTFKVKKGDRIFHRQKFIADKLLEVLSTV